MQRIVSFLLLILLTGCSTSAKRTLGLEGQAPDEFLVVSHPELVVPPSFRLLPPEGVPAKANQAAPAIMDVISATPTEGHHLSKGEAVLLQETESHTADPSIRSTIDHTEVLPKKDVVGRFKKAIHDQRNPTTKALDPAAERQRLKEEKEAQKGDNVTSPPSSQDNP